MAQLGSALRSGRRGRRFKSCHPDPAQAAAVARFGCIRSAGSWSRRPPRCAIERASPGRWTRPSLTSLAYAIISGISSPQIVNPAMVSRGSQARWYARSQPAAGRNRVNPVAEPDPFTAAPDNPTEGFALSRTASCSTPTRRRGRPDRTLRQHPRHERRTGSLGRDAFRGEKVLTQPNAFTHYFFGSAPSLLTLNVGVALHGLLVNCKVGEPMASRSTIPSL